jgi:hypothetical protein
VTTPRGTDVLRALAPWLVAVAAVTALAVVLAGAPPGGGRTGEPAATAAASLPLHPGANAVAGIFGKLTPYSVQRDMGASGGKAADCSIYSDGDLDSGADVTWAVTLCVVHSSPAGVAG